MKTERDRSLSAVCAVLFWPGIAERDGRAGHEASPGVKVLVISVLEELAKPREPLEAGPDAVLGKLATTDRVLATIRSL
jgi:hypothetical protein